MTHAAGAGRELKYARPELERRFLFHVTPEGQVLRMTRITDRYILGTRIRLRQAIVSSGGEGDREEIVYKLSQKVSGASGETGLITTMYLDPAEYAVLAMLPGAPLKKLRLSIPPLGIDVFGGALTGLVLGEVEFDDDQSMAAFPMPTGAVAEVTNDARLTGGRLAATTPSDLAAVLADYGLSI